MKTFLVKDKTETTKATPIIKWGILPDNTFFEGDIPNGYNLAVNPSEGFVVVDVDVKGKKNGFNFIPLGNITNELRDTFSYQTKSGGKHFWLKYTGKEYLLNKATNEGIDLRTDKGYVIYYPKDDIRNNIHLINETSPLMNEWLERLFS